MRTDPELASQSLRDDPRSASGAARSGTAKDFEAMALDQFLQPMFSTIDSENDPFGGGAAEATLKPMLITEFAKLMEARGGLGLSSAITDKMAQLQAAEEQKR